MFGVYQVASVLLLLSCSAASDEFSRKLSWAMNPGCRALFNASVCDDQRLLVVTASGPDTLYLLVSLNDTPAVLLLRAPLHAPLRLQWQKLVSPDPAGGVAVHGATAVYGCSLDKLLEFDDPSDGADLFHNANISATPVGRLRLGNGTFRVVANDSSRLLVSLTSPPLNSTGLGTAGTVTFKFEVLNSERRSDELPHLQQTGNSAIVGVVLDGLRSSANYTHPRYAVTMTTVGSVNQTLDQSKSLDDEYTPGVFKLVSLSSGVQASLGYLQWRPVAYTDPDLSLEHSTTARDYNVSSRSAPPPAPLLRAYFGNMAPVNSLNVSFGLSEDGWYSDSRYAAWSATVGVGAPPADKFSLMVLLLLSIGLGLPAVALVTGGVWLVVRRVRGAPDRSPLVVEEED